MSEYRIDAKAVLVTVGTSLPFDWLIQFIDNLVAEGFLYNVYGQIGNGKYIPRYFKQYRRFVGNMEEAYNHAGLVISACGAGTIMEVVKRGIPLIVVSNPDITGGHEWELARKMEELGYLIFCQPYDIMKALRLVKDKVWKKYEADGFKIDLITSLLEEV